MILILVLGGAYQGKLEYAYENYGESLSVFQCTESDVNIDFSKNIINSFHSFVFACTRNKIDTLKFIPKNLEKFQNKIIICDDISSGIVPIDKERRLWRENMGRCITLLAKNSDEVIRVFCGIVLRIK